MSAPLPFDQVKDRLLEAQRVLNPRLQLPITHPRALLLLSRPVASVVLGDEEATVLEFFGQYWVLDVGGARTGFFNTEDDAVQKAERLLGEITMLIAQAGEMSSKEQEALVDIYLQSAASSYDAYQSALTLAQTEINNWRAEAWFASTDPLNMQARLYALPITPAPGMGGKMSSRFIWQNVSGAELASGLWEMQSETLEERAARAQTIQTTADIAGFVLGAGSGATLAFKEGGRRALIWYVAKTGALVVGTGYGFSKGREFAIANGATEEQLFYADTGMRLFALWALTRPATSVAAKGGGGGWSNLPGGVRIKQTGNYWIKEVNPGASALAQWWGRGSLNAQARGLDRLGDMAPSHLFKNGKLITRDAGPYTPGNFWSTWAEGSLRLRTPFNDIRPRNIGSGGLIFDPAKHPIQQGLEAGAVGLGIGVGVVYLYNELND